MRLRTLILLGQIFAFSMILNGQSMGTFLSTLDNKQYELKETDGTSLDMYAADGKIVATMSRKKASDKFKGETRSLASKCPGDAGKIEVVEMLASRIRMRIETPSLTTNSKMGCMVGFLPEWDKFELIKQSDKPLTASASPVAEGKTPVVPPTARGGSQTTTQANPPSGRGGGQTTAQPRGSVAGARPQAGQGGAPLAAQQTGDGTGSQPGAQAPQQPLVKEYEELVVQTFLNGAGPFVAGAVTLDEAGNAYIGGTCRGVPVVAKLDKSGSFFHFQSAIAAPGIPRDYCTHAANYIYGNPLVTPNATVRTIHRDAQGKVIIAGFLQQPESFHSVNAFRPKPTAGPNGQTPRYYAEAFVAKLSADGKTIEYSTLVGGLGQDYLYSSFLTPSGDLWLTGSTTSADFPRISSLMDYKGETDAFVVMLDSAGKPRFSSTYGGPDTESGNAIGAAGDGHVLVAGVSRGTDRFPYSTPVQDGCDVDCGFLLDIDPSRKALDWARRIGPIQRGKFGRFNPSALYVGDDGIVHLGGSGFSRGLYLKLDRSGARNLQATSLGERSFSEIFTLFVRGDVTYLGGFVGKTYALDRTRYSEQIDHGQQAFLAKVNSTGDVTWSYPMSGRNNERFSTGQTWDAPSEFNIKRAGDRTRFLAMNKDEIVVVGASSTASMPTTPKSVQPYPAQVLSQGGDETFLLGGDFLAKFKIHSTQPACYEWTVPSKLFLSNQGGQDFYAFVTANSTNCEWSIKSPDSWIKTQAIEGTRGTAMVKIDIETNVDDKRVGTIVVTGKTGETFTMQVTQSAVPMGVRLTSSAMNVYSKKGGLSQIPIDAAAETEWAVSSTAEWIKVEGAPKGKGKGSVVIRTAANPGATPRSGFVLVGDRQLTVTQGIEDLPEEGVAAAPRMEAPKPGAAPKPAAPKRIPVRTKQ